MGRSAEGPADAVLTSWHPAMNPVTCSGDDHTVLGNTSRVFLSALIRCCSVPLILWVSSRFHYLCLCLAAGGCISVQLNPSCAEHDDIPATKVLKFFSFKSGQQSIYHPKEKGGSGDSAVKLFSRLTKKYQCKLNTSVHPP